MHPNASRRTVAFLGPTGTFAEKAARDLYPGAELSPQPTVRAVVETVERGKATHGVVPLESSLDGAVAGTLEALAAARGIRIVAEQVVRVRYALAAKPGVTLDRVRSVLSHAQAIAQCEKILGEKLPHAALLAVASTAAAMETVARSSIDDGLAAIGRAEAARDLGLSVLANSIEDGPANEMRFVAVGKEHAPRTGRDRTSLLVHLDDRPGALARTLTAFDALDINVTRVESRPTRKRLGEYVFFLDVEGHEEDPAVGVALKALGKRATSLTLLGSYPIARGLLGKALAPRQVEAKAPEAPAPVPGHGAPAALVAPGAAKAARPAKPRATPAG